MILVTGGAGFIGSALIWKLNQMGLDDIWIVDRLGTDHKWKNLAPLKFRQISSPEEFLENPPKNNLNFIFHMGACSSTTERDMDFLLKNNVHFSEHLFNLAGELNIPMVYASSAATYGDGDQGYRDAHDEVHKLRPLNPYGYSKQLFDQWVLKTTATQSSPCPSHWYGLKFFNVFGPNEYHKGEMRSVVHKAFQQIVDKGRVRLFKSHRPDYSDGGQLRDFIYVKDVVDVMIHFYQRPQEIPSGLYNLGTSKARSFKDLVTAAFTALNREVHIDYFDMPEHIRDQYQYFTEAEGTKLASVLPADFRFRALEDAVADYVQSYLLRAHEAKQDHLNYL